MFFIVLAAKLVSIMKETSTFESVDQSQIMLTLHILTERRARMGSVKYTPVYVIFSFHREIQDGGEKKIQEMKTDIVLLFQSRLYDC